MCEFCPVVGHCCVCGADVQPSYVVELNGVRVRFSDRIDAAYCLSENPGAVLT